MEIPTDMSSHNSNQFVKKMCQSLIAPLKAVSILQQRKVHRRFGRPSSFASEVIIYYESEATLNYEVRQLDPPDEEEPIGCIVFYVSISVFVSTNQLNDEMLAVDRGNIEGIVRWS